MSEHIDRLTLDAYVEQMLPATERRTVEAHVTNCPTCQARLADAKQMTALLYDLPRELPASNLAARINAAVAAQNVQRAPSSARWTQILIPAGFVLGLVMFALAAPQWVGRVQLAQWPTEQTALAWLSALLADPAAMLDSMVAFVEQWLTAPVEEMNVLVILATVVLAVASVAGLAQMLSGERPKETMPKLA